MAGYQVSDALWERIEPLIPKHVNNHPLGGGRKRVDDRTVFNAILFVARTGCQWNALNATGICSSLTTHLRPKIGTARMDTSWLLSPIISSL